MKIKDLMDSLKINVPKVEVNQSVMDAVNLMSDDNFSAIMVMEGNTPRGIFTEKDLVRCHTLFPLKTINEISVQSAMTSSLIVSEPEDTLEDAMVMMIRAKIRHLPVVDKDRILTIVCLEDLVRCHVGTLTKELHYLKDYITTLQDAVND